MTGNVDPDAFREFERAAHDSIAESYHEHFACLTAVAIEPLLTAAAVEKGAGVLEVAAGSCDLAAAAKRRGAGRVLATDISPRMISLAARLHPTVEFLEANVENLPIPDGAFDSVICNFGLGHFPDPQRALLECVRVLRDRGRLAFSWWDKPER
jgi:ubiquinone/menaquinone biosynthesis C-methylase UbiE